MTSSHSLILPSLITDVPNVATIMNVKHKTIARFIYVVLPLLDVYKLPRSSIHFYFDQSGQRIAFNRNASLFLSLRYFEAWRMCLCCAAVVVTD